MPTLRPRHLVAKMLSRFCKQAVIDSFHDMWYQDKRTHAQNTFLGFFIDQFPLDCWLYQEMIFRERPAFILQTGVDRGGSLLYFATLLDLISASPQAVVIGIDIALSSEAKSLKHPRIKLIEGSSTSSDIFARAQEIIPSQFGLVVLDSDHSKDHVLKELEIYRRFTEPGRHLVVEDCNINGNPVYQSHGPGPQEAVDDFLATHTDFARDDQLWRRNMLSFHQGGWLIRSSKAAR